MSPCSNRPVQTRTGCPPPSTGRKPSCIRGRSTWYRTIKSDFYDFDEDHYRAVGRRHKGVIKLGDPLRIRVKGTNLEQKLLDYELVEPDVEDGRPALTEDEYIESLVDAPMPNRPRKPGRKPRLGALKAERERMKKERR